MLCPIRVVSCEGILTFGRRCDIIGSNLEQGETMKGFIKFASILTFGVFCFIGGLAMGQGKNSVALYCILGGTMMLLNGFATVTEIETNEIMEKKDNA